MVIGGGTVNKSPNQPTYDNGSTVQLIRRARAGWTFVNWSGDRR
jgi:hypothetical protein